MVLGTCATRSDPPAASATFCAEYAVSSPPIVTSVSRSSSFRAFTVLCIRQSGSSALSSRVVGLARDV